MIISDKQDDSVATNDHARIASADVSVAELRT
jgi:hypothetical protein